MILPHTIGLELVRATEAAAIIAGKWMGLGRAEESDLAAATAMYEILNTFSVQADIVVGEELKFTSEAVIHSHQHLGSATSGLVDLIVDPIDGRTQLSKGFPGVLSVAAVAPHNTMWRAEGCRYIEKIIVGQDVAKYLVPECIDAPAAWTLALVARAKGVDVSDLIVFVLDRERHVDLINEIRATGAHVLLRSDGDIGGALMVGTPKSGVDLLMGTGGSMEGVLAACAIKAMGGAMFVRPDPQSAEESNSLRNAGLELDRILSIDDLVLGDEIFFAATGITDSPILMGVVYHGDRAETDSLVLRSETQTRRHIKAEHLIR